MTPEQFRKIALSFPTAIESQHCGHPDFRKENKIFASLAAADAATGVVLLSVEQQSAFIEMAPEIFQPCTGAWGRRGYTTIFLQNAKVPIVRSALKLAFENISQRPKRARQKKS